MVQVRAVPTPPWCRTSYSRSLVAACPLCETYPRLKPWPSLFRPARWNLFVNSPRSAGDAGRVGFGRQMAGFGRGPAVIARSLDKPDTGCQAEDVIHLLGLAPRHQLFAAEARVGAQGNLHRGP